MKKQTTDCNIERLEKIGNLAIEMAIEDYENGDLAPTLYQQIGRALYYLEKLEIEESERKEKMKK